MGPLHGLRIIELASIGPGPFCGMMLGDLGAEVIRVERPEGNRHAAYDPLSRNRRSLACDLKQPAAVEVVLRLVQNADGFFEGFRPGVAERLGVGPDDCLVRNPKLVYGRMTGWGQEGPLAQSAGHDINYISLTGALHAIGPLNGKPIPPLNLIGDFGGGGMLLAYGMVCALLNATRTGEGQVVDAAMVDGTHALMAMYHGLHAMGMHPDVTGSSCFGGAAHFYNTYETKDGKNISIASLEPQFYDLLIDKVGLDRDRFAPHVFDWKIDAGTLQQWSELKAEIARIIRTKTRSEWCEILEGSDVCFAPVLTLAEAPEHHHNKARHAFVDVDGHPQPAPAPRFSKTPAARPKPGVAPGSDSRDVLKESGFSDAEISELLDQGAIS